MTTFWKAWNLLYRIYHNSKTWHPASKGRKKLMIRLMQWELVMQRVRALITCISCVTQKLSIWLCLNSPCLTRSFTGKWGDLRASADTLLALTFLREIMSPRLERGTGVCVPRCLRLSSLMFLDWYFHLVVKRVISRYRNTSVMNGNKEARTSN